MTNEEALKIAKSSNPLLRGKIPLDRLNYVGCIIEALEKQIQLESLAGKEYYIIPKTSKWIYKDIDVMQAVEKQIPKKPTKKYYEYINRELGRDCPSCGSTDCGCSESWENKYCCNCGQAIDWSDYDKTPDDN